MYVTMGIPGIPLQGKLHIENVASNTNKKNVLILFNSLFVPIGRVKM